MATIAFKTKISKITNGSTYAAIPSSPSPVMAITKEIVAANSNILANKSSNYSFIGETGSVDLSLYRF